MFFEKNSFPFYKQYDRTDCGPACLRMIAKYYGKVYSAEYLREQCSLTRDGVSVMGITDAAESIGFRSLVANINYKILYEDVPLPCIAYWRERHFVVVYKITMDTVYVADPEFGKLKYKKNDFIKGWTNNKFLQESDEGLVILLETSPEFDSIYEPYKEIKSGLRFLLPYFKPYKSYLIQLLIGLLLGSFLQLVFPFLTQSIVDYGIRYQNLNFINLILLGQLMIFFSQSGVAIIRGWLLLHLGSRINIAVVSDFLNKLMRLHLSFFESKIIGDIMQRVEDNRRIEAFLSSQSLSLIFSFFSLTVFLSVLFYYSLTIGFIFLVGATLYTIWILIFMKKRAELDYRRFDESAGNSSSLIQLISGMSEIKLNGSEKRRRWEWEAIQIRLYKISMKGLALSQYQMSGSNIINEVKNILITFVAAKSVITGEITLGMMLAIQYIIGQLNSPLNGLVSFIQAAQDAKISLNRIGEIHDKEDEDATSEENVHTLPGDKSIFVENLSFKYGGSSTNYILNNLNFVIPEGKVTAIVGASGSGKTTLLKLLLKFYKPNEGRISIGNLNLQNIRSDIWRRNVGAVMQDGYIFTDTLVRNITESDSEGLINKEQLLSAVKIANIEEFVESLPAGYKSRIGVAGTSGISLSGGQRQRVLIARAIYKNPEYLFFDEATSSLDANNEKDIMKKLNDFFKGKTVITIAHRLSTVKNADNILVMDKGRIIESGNHESLTKAKGAYFKLVKNQLELGD